MVDVEWDFQGGPLDQAAAEKAVGRVLAFYREALGDTLCPVHGRPPGLKVQGPTVQSLSIVIQGCCQQLLDRAGAQVDRVSRREGE